MNRSILSVLLANVFVLGLVTLAMGAAVNQVNYSSLTGTGLIEFDDVPGGSAPGTNYNNIFESNGADFGERFQGQTLSYSGGSDILSGSPSGSLALVAGAANQNLNVFLGSYGGITSQLLTGLGPAGYPDFDAIGEGSFAVLFDYDQSQFGFRLVGGEGGNAYVNFYNRGGSLIDGITLTKLGDIFYGFQREGNIKDIAGISIYNTDGGGIGFDKLLHDVPGGPGPGGKTPEPATMLLLGSGLLGLAGFRRRMKK